MRNYRVSGYAVNRRGHTVGIHYDVPATNTEQASANALRQAVADGYRYICLTSTVALEVSCDR